VTEAEEIIAIGEWDAILPYSVSKGLSWSGTKGPTVFSARSFHDVLEVKSLLGYRHAYSQSEYCVS
jgi:hypothetical protein